MVVGAGHNGLVAAAYLARAGLRVAVCERRDVIGGAAVTEELAPGYRVSSASYALSLLRPDICADLELQRHGLVAVPKDPQSFVPLEDGRSFFVWRDVERTRAEIARIHRGDAEAYPRWCAFWDEAADALRPVVEDPDATDVEAWLTGKGRGDLFRLAVAGSAAECVEAFFEHPSVQGAFASQGIIGTWASVRDPGTAWVMAYHALGGEIYGSTGTWGFARGGMGAVTGAIASAASEAGVQILKRNGVVEILVEGGRASGVRLANGLVLRAPYVVSGADPQTTFLELLASDAIDGTFRRRVASWRTDGCVLKVNLAMSELPNFAARPGRGPQHHGTVSIAPSIEYLHEAYREAADGGYSSHPFMEVFVQTTLDRGLVDGTGHVVSAFTQYVGPQARDLARDQATEAVVSTLSRYAPNVRDAIVAVESLGPRELEARFGLTGGDIFHGSMLPDQSFDRRFDRRTPVPGLYLCGSGTRPGGGVMGAAGRNAAAAVLSDLKGRATVG